MAGAWRRTFAPAPTRSTRSATSAEAVIFGYAMGSGRPCRAGAVRRLRRRVRDLAGSIGVTSDLDTLLSLSNPYVIVGLLLGALLPYLLGAMGVTASAARAARWSRK